MEKPLVQLTDIDVAYQKQVALTNVSFSIHERDFIGIIGPNGGGKTTLGFNIAMNVADHDKVGVVVITLEMAAIEVGFSTLAKHSKQTTSVHVCITLISSSRTPH